MPKTKAKRKNQEIEEALGEKPKATSVSIQDYEEINKLWDHDRRGRLAAETQILALQTDLQKKQVELEASRLAATGLKGDTQYSVPTHLISKLREISGYLNEASIGNADVGRANLRVQAMMKDLGGDKFPDKVQTLIEAIHIGAECAKLRSIQGHSEAMEEIFWAKLGEWL